MISGLKFHPPALRDWKRLDPGIRARFLLKLQERMENPQIPKDRLSGDLSNCYKVKLVRDGYRLVYEPKFEDGVLFIRSVGRRDDDVYKKATISLS